MKKLIPDGNGKTGAREAAWIVFGFSMIFAIIGSLAGSANALSVFEIMFMPSISFLAFTYGQKKVGQIVEKKISAGVYAGPSEGGDYDRYRGPSG